MSASSKASQLPIKIRPAVPEDLDTCAICWGNRRDTYPSIYPLRLYSPLIPQSERLQRNLPELKAELADTDFKTFHVATTQDPETSAAKVVGFSIWQKPGAVERDSETLRKKESGQEQAAEGDEDPECDVELAKKLKKESLEVKARYSEGTPLWFLHMLFILPEYQRRGVGTALIEHGLALIDSSSSSSSSSSKSNQSEGAGTTIGLTSSPQGQKLYQRYGFESVYWFRPKLQDLNEKGEMVDKEVSWPLMLCRRP